MTEESNHLSVEQQELQRFSIKGKVIVVTGCTGVLGRAYCQAMALRGARLVMADLLERDPVCNAAQLASSTGAEVIGVACDVGVESDVIELFKQALSRFRRVDVVLNNAAATGAIRDIGPHLALAEALGAAVDLDIASRLRTARDE